MKKIFTAVLLFGASVLFGCSNKIDDENTIYAVATEIPHAEILKECIEPLKTKGYNLLIETVDSYSLPNPAVANYTYDLNYFQHKPYLDQYNETVPEDKALVSIADIHLEPIGLYSPSKYGYKSLADLKDGDTIIMSNSVSDLGRLLKILESENIVTLKENIDPVYADLDDITSYNVNISINNKSDAKTMTQSYLAGSAPVILINGNYALSAGIDPLNDAFYTESTMNNPYSNVVAVRAERKDIPKIKAFLEVITSGAIKDFINTKYKGSVIPVQ